MSPLKDYLPTQKILLIDDDETLLSMLEKGLVLHGFQIRTLAEPVRAVQVANEWQPGLIILDIMMPRIEGIWVLQRLRENIATRDTPIIILTSIENAQKEMVAYAAGATDYVTKPVALKDLIDCIRKFLKPESL